MKSNIGLSINYYVSKQECWCCCCWMDGTEWTEWTELRREREKREREKKAKVSCWFWYPFWSGLSRQHRLLFSCRTNASHWSFHICLFDIICFLYYLSHFRLRSSFYNNANGNMPQLFCHVHLPFFSISLLFRPLIGSANPKSRRKKRTRKLGLVGSISPTKEVHQVRYSFLHFSHPPTEQAYIIR